MRVIRNIKTLQTTLAKLRAKGKSIGFVPTMGYFHEGHLSLMRQAKKQHDICVVSVYVNPKQFGPKEDLSRYPRDFKRDSSLMVKENVDICFFASDNDIYPNGYLTYIDVNKISDVLCGAYRPNHFQGVATIVAKLLNMVGPSTMYLGAKDAQQVVVLKRMVVDLNFPVKVVVGATIREADGLALSSRNVFLSPLERAQAVVISKALFAAKESIAKGERKAKNVIAIMQRMISKASLAKIQYIACVDAQQLTPLTTLQGDVLLALAVYFGKTRLIDNVVVKINGSKKIKN